MKHHIDIQDDSPSINCQLMEIGDIAVILSGAGGIGLTLMRTSSGFVILEDPHLTWSHMASDFVVRKLPKGAQITLTVGGGE